MWCIGRCRRGISWRSAAFRMVPATRHGSLQAANLTKQLLAYSRRQVLDVHPADLCQVVSAALLVLIVDE